MLRNALHVPQLQAELGQHLEFTRDVESANYQENIQKIANNWFPVGLAFGVLGVSYGWDHLSSWLKEPDLPAWPHIMLFIRDLAPAFLILYAVLVVFRWINKMPHRFEIWRGWR
jgi:hypothetical protein